MAVPETLVRDRVRSVVEAEFADLGWTVANDKLPRAAGKDGRAKLAVWPEGTFEQFRDANVLDIEVILQVYLAYEAEPDEHIVRDPGEIEAIADRLRRAFSEEANVGGTSDFWFLRISRIDFPDDPTGNKTRLEARFTARCDNPTL